PLEGFDPELVELLGKRARELGITVELGVDVLGVDSARDRLVVRGMQGGQERRFETDLAVHGAGRVPEIDDLDLATAGVQRERRVVVLQEFIQSLSNSHIYASA